MRETLPYRPNVSIIAFKEDQFLVVNRVQDKPDTWKFPQGGIDNGEDAISAGLREFSEELGTSNLEIVGLSKHENRYEWPDEQIHKHNQKYDKQWRGQKQRFVIARYVGSDEDFKPDPDEISSYAWVSREQVLTSNKKREHLFEQYDGLIQDIFYEFEL